MGEILIKDGVRYTIHEYADEDELEKMVVEHYKEIFGENALFFNKQKIKTRSGIGTIPDGFVLSMDDNKWYIIEVELDSHPLYEHIVPQITKFNSAMKNPSSKKRMVKAFYDEIKEDPTKSLKVQDENIKELYKFISETLDTKPEIIIAINSKTGELDEVCESLPFSSKIIEFKTFEKEDAPSVHVHLFEPNYKVVSGEKTIQPIGKKEIEIPPQYPRGVARNQQIVTVYNKMKEGISYQEAVKKTARELNIAPQTVADKCVRQLKGVFGEEFSTEQFMRKVENAIELGLSADEFIERVKNKSI